MNSQSDLSSATINEQFDTCYETGVIRRQKQRRFGNFVSVPHPSHRDGGHDSCNGVCRLSIDNRRIGRPRANDVRTNMTFLEIRGPGSDEGAESGLGRAIDAEGGRAFYARYRAVEDNRAAIELMSFSPMPASLNLRPSAKSLRTLRLYGFVETIFWRRPVMKT
jgi:hypothetical protein